MIQYKHIKIGDIFEHLTCIGFGENKKFEQTFIFECDCKDQDKNQIEIRKYNLKTRTHLYCNLEDCKYNESNWIIINDIKYSLLPGSIIGNLKIIEKIHAKNKHFMMLLKCLCGSDIELSFNKYGLSNKVFLDCGLDTCQYVISKTRIQNFNLYQVWLDIKQKCYNPNNKDFQTYGLRGIIMLTTWVNDFQAFKDYVNTLSPNKLQFILAHPNDRCTLGRIDNNGNYEPNNLRWETDKEQAKNKTTTVFLKSDIPNIRKASSMGETLSSIAQRYNCGITTIENIIKNRTWKDIK